MEKFFKKVQDVFNNKSLKKKIIFTIVMLAVYRLLVFIPVPFIDIGAFMSRTMDASGAGLGYFVMLLG